MKVRAIAEHEQTDVALEGAAGVKMRMLIGPDDGAPHFHMRHFEVERGGETPHHSHNFEHEILVLSGSGIARSEQGDRRFQAGDVVFVPAGERHQFVNDGDGPLAFVCVIPAPESCSM